MYKHSYIVILLLFLVVSSAGLFGQFFDDSFYATPEDLSPPDTTAVFHEEYSVSLTETIITTDTIIAPVEGIPVDTATTQKAFKPDAEKVMWLGAIIPGYGQILNKKYWKLPIVYGGFMGCAFAISYFSSEYQTYKIAYRDIMNGGGTSYMDLLPPGTTMDNYGGKSAYAANIKNGMDYYLRWRDLSILITVVYYGLTILEAYVDAQLFDFDISPDLALRIQPAVINNDVNYTKPVTGPDNMLGRSNAFGLQWSFRLK